MIARAVQERWPIKPEFREALVKRLTRIIADPNSSPREVTAASKALISAEKQNQDDQHKVVDVELSREHARLASIAADLGIDASVIEDASREAGGNLDGAEQPQAANVDQQEPKEPPRSKQSSKQGKNP